MANLKVIVEKSESGELFGTSSTLPVGVISTCGSTTDELYNNFKNAFEEQLLIAREVDPELFDTLAKIETFEFCLKKSRF